MVRSTLGVLFSFLEDSDDSVLIPAFSKVVAALSIAFAARSSGDFADDSELLTVIDADDSEFFVEVGKGKADGFMFGGVAVVDGGAEGVDVVEVGTGSVVVDAVVMVVVAVVVVLFELARLNLCVV